MPNASKICCEQVVGAPAAADILPGRSRTYQVAVGIERDQKSRFAGTGARLNPLQCVFVDEERGLDGAVVSPEPHGMPRPIIRAAVIWKVDHGSGRSGCRCRAPAFSPFESELAGWPTLDPRTSGTRTFRPDEDAPVAPLSNEDLATGQQSDSMPIATNSFLISLAIRRRDHYIQFITARPSAVIGD
jgi:hypothetical protein